MDVGVLGPIQVKIGSQLVDPGSRMHRAVLSRLVMDVGRVVSADQIIDCLWGGEPPASALQALHVYVFYLRKVLEPNRPRGARSQVLVTKPPGYVLQVPPNAIDATRFQALATEGRQLLESGQPEAAYDVLGLGLALWRGSAYQDFTFDAFAQSEIARLHELRASAADTRIQAVLDRGRAAEAVVDADGLVAEDPLRERRWGLLALALYRDGRQGDALRALERARQTLAEELGLEPGPELRRLEQDVLNHAPTLDWRPPAEQPFTGGRRVPLLHGVPMASVMASMLVASPVPPGTGHGSVLPADACPDGYCLADMAAAVASFNQNGHDPDLYPDTPFQILYVELVNVEMIGGGLLGTGERSFTVPSDTRFFTVLFVATDNPPVADGFPTSASEAGAWAFDPARYGAREFEIVIDGRRTLIGPEYVTGPTPILRDEGHHAIVLSAFLGPMTPGTHTVTVRGGVFGPSAGGPYSLAFMQEEFTYTVEVLPPE